MPSPKFLSPKNEVNEEIALSAIAAYPTLQEASEYLKEQHNIIASPAKLQVKIRLDAQRLEELRSQIAPFKEKLLKNELQDTALVAAATTKLAVESSQRLLAAGRVQDPSKVARDLSQVMTQSVDKKALLEGKPTQIIQNRTPDEIVLQLEAMGVAKRTELDVPDAEVIE